MIQFIFAVGRRWEFSSNGDLPFNGHPCQKYDLKLFKEYTDGKIVVMGRKTFESLPFRLPNRMNVVLSSLSDVKAENGDLADIYFDLKAKRKTLKEFLEFLDTSDRDVVVIGGARMLEEASEFANAGYLTMYDTYYPDADTYINPSKISKDLVLNNCAKVTEKDKCIHIVEYIRSW